MVCTQDDEETHEDGGQSPHAEPEDLLLLHELAVGPGVAGGTEAGVPLCVVPVDAGAAVVTGIVQTLVTVLAALSVRSDSLATGTPEPAPRVSSVWSVSRVELVPECLFSVVES